MMYVRRKGDGVLRRRAVLRRGAPFASGLEYIYICKFLMDRARVDEESDAMRPYF